MDPTRRQILVQLGLLLGGLAIAPTALAGGTHPVTDDQDQTLAAFVETVCPRSSEALEDALAALGDETFPMARHRSLLAKDLDRRAQSHGRDHFVELTVEEREDVVAEGLGTPGLLRPLYAGAVFLCQVAWFPGIYHPERGNPSIHFPGTYTFRGYAALSYPNPASWFGPSLGSAGNPP